MFFACQAAARVMRAQGGGRILNVASGADLLTVTTSRRTRSARRASGQLTRSLAAEWAGDGIRVNARRAGARAHGETEAVFADPVQATPRSSRRSRSGAASVPEDLAGTGLLLVSDAGAYITGQTLSVDGGWNLGLVGA